METKKRTAAIFAGLGLGIGVLIAPLQGALAGHTNTVLNADLDGRQEVADDGRTGVVGDPNGQGEVYIFGVDGDSTTLCYVLTVDKIGTATAAHIHEGPAGGNGPVVTNLAAPGDGDAADCLTEGEAGKFTGGATVQEILANPEQFYVNVHNSEYPSGAIRGQLSSI